jgi:hypothetical protein
MRLFGDTAESNHGILLAHSSRVFRHAGQHGNLVHAKVCCGTTRAENF